MVIIPASEEPLGMHQPYTANFGIFIQMELNQSQKKNNPYREMCAGYNLQNELILSMKTKSM